MDPLTIVLAIVAVALVASIVLGVVRMVPDLRDTVGKIMEAWRSRRGD